MATVTSPASSQGSPDRRAQIGVRTLRTDKWWVMPLVMFLIFMAFIAYSTWRAFENAYYFAEPLLSPFYSPCLGDCVEGASDFGQPFAGFPLSAALIILIFPLGFRLTCYYYRKAYYRAFWLSPPACGVAEPHGSYSGETRFPLIFQNSHRYFFYLGLVLNVILTYDAIVAFRNHEGAWGHMSIGTLILVIAVLGIFLIRASANPAAHASLIWFTVWSSIAHAAVMALQGIQIGAHRHAREQKVLE